MSVHLPPKEYKQDVRSYYAHYQVNVFVVWMQFILFMVSTKRFIFHVIELIARPGPIPTLDFISGSSSATTLSQV